MINKYLGKMKKLQHLTKNVSEELYKNIKKKDLVIISDYNKGCINKSIGNKLKKLFKFSIQKTKPVFISMLF